MPQPLPYITPIKSRAKLHRLVVLGAMVLAMGIVMFVVKAAHSMAAAPPPPVIDWIGTICWYGWLYPCLIGAVMLIVGSARYFK
jgi:hypothetical protein